MHYSEKSNLNNTECRPIQRIRGFSGVDAFYLLTYLLSFRLLIRDQKRFTISEVAADCHELMIP